MKAIIGFAVVMGGIIVLCVIISFIMYLMSPKSVRGPYGYLQYILKEKQADTHKTGNSAQ